jgi:hypothetical protein
VRCTSLLYRKKNPDFKIEILKARANRKRALLKSYVLFIFPASKSHSGYGGGGGGGHEPSRF